MLSLLRRCKRFAKRRLGLVRKQFADLFLLSKSRGGIRRGPRSFVHHSVQILGKQAVEVGSNTVLSQDCWLNVNHRHVPGPAITIGSNCFIGRRNFFSSGRRISLKDYVLTANDCHFLGSTHIADDPMRPIICTGTTDTDDIIVGVNTFLGAGARIVGNVTIGQGCVIAAGATVTRDIPAFSQVVGSPAKVRRRYSVPRKAWLDPDEFTAHDEEAIPTEADYLSRLKAFGAINMPHIAAGRDLGDL